jgi:hypothetical protein
MDMVDASTMKEPLRLALSLYALSVLIVAVPRTAMKPDAVSESLLRQLMGLERGF